MYVYEFIVVDIVPDIEEKTSVSVVKEGWIGATSENIIPGIEVLTLISKFFLTFLEMIPFLPRRKLGPPRGGGLQRSSGRQGGKI